jgi:hypothetical protein
VPARARPLLAGARSPDGAHERVLPVLRQPQGQRHEFSRQVASENRKRVGPNAQSRGHVRDRHRHFRPAGLVALPRRPRLAGTDSRPNRQQEVLPCMCPCGISRASTADFPVDKTAVLETQAAPSKDGRRIGPPQPTPAGPRLGRTPGSPPERHPKTANIMRASVGAASA